MYYFTCFVNHTVPSRKGREKFELLISNELTVLSVVVVCGPCLSIGVIVDMPSVACNVCDCLLREQ